jgi:hypothetical protein
VCARLDGIPLAIELAAARCPALGPAELAARLDGHPGLLSGGPARPGRHRSLEALVAWSYELLDEAERRLRTALLARPGGYFTGLLGAELAETDQAARAQVAARFRRWEPGMRSGLQAMRHHGRLGSAGLTSSRWPCSRPAGRPGGLLLTRLQRSTGPLETTLDAMLTLIERREAV